MRISIVVPTRDRPVALARCLAALGDEHEVVVVDDPSGRGPAWARNEGARRSAGDVICFTDDDCLPRPGWATTLAATAQASGAAAGRTVAPARAAATISASQAIVEHLTMASLTAHRRLGFAPTCNLALTREAFVALPFDEGFSTAAGEDRDWADRAGALALAPVYEPGAVVVHAQAPGLAGFARRQYRYGRGAARYRAADPRRRLPGPGFYAGLVRRGFAEGAAVGALVVGAQVATAAGVAAERLAGLGGERR